MTWGDIVLPWFVCSALDLSFGNHRNDQAGQKSISHLLGAIFKRTGAVSPDFSRGFHCFHISWFLRMRWNRLFCGILDWGRNRTNM